MTGKTRNGSDSLRSREIEQFVDDILGKRANSPGVASQRKSEPAETSLRSFRRWLIEVSDVRKADWDEDTHPRLGGPPNAGWFAATGDSSDANGRAAAMVNGNRNFQREPVAADAPSAVQFRAGDQLAQAPIERGGPTKVGPTWPAWPEIETKGPSAGTPKQPTGNGLAIAIFGEKDNPKYADYSSDPEFDSYRKRGVRVVRPNTSTLKDKSVSDISVRGSPLNTGSWKEIVRIAKPGATITIAYPFELWKSSTRILRTARDFAMTEKAARTLPP